MNYLCAFGSARLAAIPLASVCWPFVCALIESFRCPGRSPIVEPVQLICALCSLLAITFTQEHHNVQSFRPGPLRGPGPGLGFAQRPDAFSLIVIVCGNLISAFSTRVCTFSLPLSSLSPSPSRRHVCPLCVCVCLFASETLLVRVRTWIFLIMRVM